MLEYNASTGSKNKYQQSKQKGDYNGKKEETHQQCRRSRRR